MKKQDLMTIVGVVLGVLMMIWGMAMGPKGMFDMQIPQLKLFWDMASVVITVGGSFCALLINYSLTQMKNFLNIITQSFKESQMSNIDIINKFDELSKKARREGLLSLEEQINEIDDEYLKKGLQMVVDGIEPETIREILELEIGEMERRHGQGIDMLKAWAAYAPAFGMIGTLIGLIQMLANLSDSSQIASGMGKALITTFYGALMANLILTPMASSLGLKSGIEVAVKEMMLEGVLAIQSGVNPRIVQEKLMCYLSPEERKQFMKKLADSEGVA